MKQQTKNSNLLFIVLLLIAGTAFLLLNILSSQTVSPLYSGLVNEDKQATATYLQKIRLLPQFTQELPLYESKFGPEFKDLVYSDEHKRQAMIAQLEQMLNQNPKARDVLYGLYLLYKEGRNGSRAPEYLRRAQEVDPMIKAN